MGAAQAAEPRSAIQGHMVGRRGQVMGESMGGGGVAPPAPANRNTPPPADFAKIAGKRAQDVMRKEGQVSLGKEGVYTVKELPNKYSIVKDTNTGEYDMLNPRGDRISGGHNNAKSLVKSIFNEFEIDRMGGLDALTKGVR